MFDKSAHLKISIVAGATPLLLSRPAMSDLGLVIDFEIHTVSSRKLQLESTRLDLVQNHYVLSLISSEYIADGSGSRQVVNPRLVFATDSDHTHNQTSYSTLSLSLLLPFLSTMTPTTSQFQNHIHMSMPFQMETIIRVNTMLRVYPNKFPPKENPNITFQPERLDIILVIVMLISLKEMSKKIVL